MYMHWAFRWLSALCTLIHWAHYTFLCTLCECVSSERDSSRLLCTPELTVPTKRKWKQTKEVHEQKMRLFVLVDCEYHISHTAHTAHEFPHLHRIHRHECTQTALFLQQEQCRGKHHRKLKDMHDVRMKCGKRKIKKKRRNSFIVKVEKFTRRRATHTHRSRRTRVKCQSTSSIFITSHENTWNNNKPLSWVVLVDHNFSYLYCFVHAHSSIRVHKLSRNIFIKWTKWISATAHGRQLSNLPPGRTSKSRQMKTWNTMMEPAPQDGDEERVRKAKRFCQKYN